MAIEMHSKYLEEINKLADQLSRLTLADEIEKPVDVTVYNDVVSNDKELTDDKESISVLVNGHEPLQEENMVPTKVLKGDTSLVSETFTKFYAVALPAEAERPSDPCTLVYNDFKDALKAVKSFKGSRFKEFTNKEDALLFASKSLDKVVAKAKVDEDGSTFRSATSQELCQLRKHIECGNIVSFAKTVWGNPKILVGTSDTPSIMQEGMRYNALHVAAKSNKPFLCQLVLDTIENPKFLKMIYPLKSDVEREKIVCRLLDLYMNTPDKKTGDTPLHYASKFGWINCVKVLLAHPSCVPDRKNIAGFTAREIICTRSQVKSPELIKEIDDAFNGLMYIPILRSETNDVQPVVGKPSSCKEIIESTWGFEPKGTKSLLSLKAFIGPMSPIFAEQVYLVIKKPTNPQVFLYSPEELQVINKIRYSDREKGLERIGRWLADDLNFQWQEYFPFLSIFTNLALEDGLKALETHLEKNQHDCYVPDEQDEMSIFLVHHYPSQVNPLAHYVNVHLEREKEKHYDSNYDEMYRTPPSSPKKNPDGDCFVTPPSSPSTNMWNEDVFLQGPSLTKLDIDVLLAIGDTTVDSNEYPNISNWKSAVERKMKSAKEERTSSVNSLSLLTSVVLPRLRISENICTPRKTLLNKAFRLENSV